MGQRPYADFFYHQLPLHLYVLSLASSVAPHSLYLHRLPALLAVAGTGGVLYLLTARLTSPAVAALTAAVYYAMPLQNLALLVLPNSPMLFFCTCAMLLMLFDDRAGRVTLGAVCLLVAVLWKPLALATVVIIGLLLLRDRSQRWKLVPMTLVLAIGAVASLVVLHVLSRGGFDELLALQLHRYTHKTGFEIMQHYTTVAALLKRIGVRSFLDWNIQSHFRAFEGHRAIVLLTARGGRVAPVEGQSGCPAGNRTPARPLAGGAVPVLALRVGARMGPLSPSVPAAPRHPDGALLPPRAGGTAAARSHRRQARVGVGRWSSRR
jgi:4-amino-4-deoxy-L-arabinose transferase-like glycosyltransferase